MLASVPVTLRCRSVVPRLTMATGVSGERPCATSVAAIGRMFRKPISTTSVPGVRASCAQSSLLSGDSGINMAGDDGDHRVVLAMGQRNAGIARRRMERRNSRHHLERNARLRQHLRLLAAAPKHVGIAAFEAHDAFAFARFGHQQRIQLLL